MQESGEMYLESILVLSQNDAPVRSMDVAKYLGVSKPSVSRAMAILKTGNYVEIDRQGYITLAEEGRKIAEKIYERHIVLSKFFISLGTDRETAEEDACRIEHVISDKTFEIVKKHVTETEAVSNETAPSWLLSVYSYQMFLLFGDSTCRAC